MNWTAQGIYFVAFVLARKRHYAELRNFLLHILVQRNIALWELEQTMDHTVKAMDAFAAALGNIAEAERAEFDDIASRYEDPQCS